MIYNNKLARQLKKKGKSQPAPKQDNSWTAFTKQVHNDSQTAKLLDGSHGMLSLKQVQVPVSKKSSKV